MTTEDSIGLGIFVLTIIAFIGVSHRAARKKRTRVSPNASALAQSHSVEDSPGAARPGARVPVLTGLLIAISIVMSFVSNFGASLAPLSSFLIAHPGSQGFEDVLHGQAWRLVTPIFIHFGVLHILFNMMWLWDLGSLLEKIKGRVILLGLILSIGIVSNIAQYTIGQSPFFGGMSGVVYGLLGYVWVIGRRQPHSGLALDQRTVFFMAGWFVLCWTGLLGPIANWAHLAGLVTGLAVGYATSTKRPSAAA